MLYCHSPHFQVYKAAATFKEQLDILLTPSAAAVSGYGAKGFIEDMATAPLFAYTATTAACGLCNT